MSKKQQQEGPVKQEYLVKVQIGGAGDAEIWYPGSGIWLTDDEAAVHLRYGNIEAINQTVVPEPPASDVVIHEAQETPEASNT